MKTEQAFMNLGTNKFFFHYVFGKKIKDFAQDHKHGFCAEEFCFKEVLTCKGIISVEESINLQFHAFIILPLHFRSKCKEAAAGRSAGPRTVSQA